MFYNTYSYIQSIQLHVFLDHKGPACWQEPDLPKLDQAKFKTENITRKYNTLQIVNSFVLTRAKQFNM